MPSKDAATVTVKGKEYDVNADFTWRELATVEELAGQPLGARGAMDSALVGGAFIFVVLKRDDPTLEWGAFLDSPVSDVVEDEEADGEEAMASASALLPRLPRSPPPLDPELARHYGIKPWEMDLLTPLEERSIHRHRDAMREAADGNT
jgi:hypothetical protein